MQDFFEYFYLIIFLLFNSKLLNLSINLIKPLLSLKLISSSEDVLLVCELIGKKNLSLSTLL